jgi:hypothetical protein
MSAVDEKREIFAHAFIANMAGGMPRNKAAITAAEDVIAAATMA